MYACVYMVFFLLKSTHRPLNISRDSEYPLGVGEISPSQKSEGVDAGDT